MFKIRNTRQIIIIFAILSFIFFLYSEKIITAILGLNHFWILLIVPLLNPIYLLFYVSLGKEYGFKGVISSYIISLAVTIISLPHYIQLMGGYSAGYMKLITDINIWNLIPDFLKFTIFGFNFGSLLLYIIIPLFLIVIALMCLHKKKFKEVFLKSV